MTVLCDHDLHALILLHPNFIKGSDNVGTPYNTHDFVNPASIDIHVGWDLLIERPEGGFQEIAMLDGQWFDPGAFALVATAESFQVPNGYALELRLKSTSARLGWDHSLAFWVDPGWRGVLTMEVRNATKYQRLRLDGGQRFAQVVVHRLSGAADHLYQGKYNDTNRASAVKLRP